MTQPTAPRYDVVVVGGLGHVGLPLAICWADKGLDVCVFDIDERKGRAVAEGRMPFVEEGAQELLPKVLASGRLVVGQNPAVISEARNVVIVTGTPVDRHLNPEFESIQNVLESYVEHLRDGQLVVLRSTVYPGTTERIRRWLHQRDKMVELAFCPERIAQGSALRELQVLPQIISSFSEDGLAKARALFGRLCPDVVVLPPIEAELAKLFTNAWRYIQFATTNQFFMIANSHGADFHRLHHAMTYRYERAKDMPKPGFAAGPCLFKDTMQLAAFNNNSFTLGHAAMLINEGLPNYIVQAIKSRVDLAERTVGILGMTFKPNNDDRRESLCYKLRKILTLDARKVLCSDVYLPDADFVSARDLLREADVIILGVPHREYAGLPLPKDKMIVDVWNFWGRGGLI